MIVIKKLSFYSLLMLIVPLFVWATGWQWAGDQHFIPSLDYPLYWLTETGSVPYAIITCVLFMLWIMWLTRKRYSWLLVGFICAVSVIGTQAVKTVAKATFAEPRPYVMQMMGDQTEQFYELDRSKRADLVATYYKASEYPLIAHHRANETGYSFPSGHAIFSVSWLLVFGGLLLGMRGQAVIFAQLFAMVWSMLMLISRLRLGMHFPIDLFVSTILAWAFHIVLFVWIIPPLSKWQFFQKRGE